jgi:hypothetical protein
MAKATGGGAGSGGRRGGGAVGGLGGVFRVEVDGHGDGFADGLVIDVTSATTLTRADFLF